MRFKLEPKIHRIQIYLFHMSSATSTKIASLHSPSVRLSILRCTIDTTPAVPIALLYTLVSQLPETNKKVHNQLYVLSHENVIKICFVHDSIK